MPKKTEVPNERKPRAGKEGVVFAKKRVARKTTPGAKRGGPAKN